MAVLVEELDEEPDDVLVLAACAIPTPLPTKAPETVNANRPCRSHFLNCLTSSRSRGVSRASERRQGKRVVQISWESWRDSQETLGNLVAGQAAVP